MLLPSDPTKVEIAELALQLHKSRSSSLTIPVPEGKVVDVPNGFSGAVEEGQIRFASLEEVNSIVAGHMLADLRALGPLRAESLFDAAYELWRCEIGRSDMAAGRLLASVSEADVLSMAVERIADGAQVFDVLHVVQAFLLHAENLRLDSLIALNDAQYEKTKRDMAAGMLFSSIESWLSNRLEVAEKLTHQLVSAPVQTRESLLGAAWMGWFKSNATSAAQEILLVADRAQHAQAVPLAIRLAGRMLCAVSLDSQCKEQLENLINGRLVAANEQERQAAIQAATGLIHLADCFNARLSELADTENQVALAHIAMALGAHQKELLERGKFFYWLDHCTSLSSEYKEATEVMEYSLSLLIVPAGAYLHPALSFIKTWVKKQPKSGPINRQFSESLGECSRQILNQPTLLSRWLTEWLLNDDAKLPASVAGVLVTVAASGVSSLKFDTEILDGLNQEDLVFLARRLLGYIHDPDQLLSLALSLLDMADREQRVFPMMRSLLIEEIGYDFPGSTIETLKEASQSASDDTVRHLLDSICSVIEIGMNKFEELPRLKELAPSTDLRRQFVLARGRQMRDAAKEAEKDSVFRQIATTTYIKAGHTTFQYQRDSYTEPMHMKSISHSYQLPRREILDPVGNAIRGFQMRNARRGTQ